VSTAARAAGLAVDDPGGDGRPFVWAHGLTSSRAAEDATALFPWREIDGLRTIRYDARGHGSSPGPADPASYEWPALALDLVAVLDASGLDRCAIGGASMGCVTALGATLIVPQRIERLVLVTPPTAWNSRPAQRAVYEEAARLVERRGIDELIELSRGETPPAVLGDAGALVHQAGLEQIAAMNPDVLAAILRGAAVSDLPPPGVLAAVTQPTLVLAWVDDAGHPVSTAEILADTLPAADLHVASDLDAVRSWPGVVETFLLA
jgi:3-oxoadipate enol-lactonase